jgi:hypothetical protein
MKRTFAAVIFCLLTVTAPAHAVTVEAINITFPTGTLTGDLAFSPCCFPGNMLTLDLSLNGVGLFEVTGEPGSREFPALFWNPPPAPPTPTIFATIAANFGDLPPNPTFSDFTLNEAVGQSGTVSCVSGCTVTPLPAALPLFASAMAGLGGVGWLRRRGKVSLNRHAAACERCNSH